MIPVNARGLLAFVNKISDNPMAYFKCNYEDFDKKTNDVVQLKFNERKQYIEELYNKCVAETIKRLIQEEYLLSEKDWNRKNNKIKYSEHSFGCSFCSTPVFASGQRIRMGFYIRNKLYICFPASFYGILLRYYQRCYRTVYR